MRISDWSSDVCSSDLNLPPFAPGSSPGQALSLSKGRSSLEVGKAVLRQAQHERTWDRASLCSREGGNPGSQAFSPLTLGSRFRGSTAPMFAHDIGRE